MSEYEADNKYFTDNKAELWHAEAEAAAGRILSNDLTKWSKADLVRDFKHLLRANGLPKRGATSGTGLLYPSYDEPIRFVEAEILRRMK